jgi:hypothetical protein
VNTAEKTPVVATSGEWKWSMSTKSYVQNAHKVHFYDLMNGAPTHELRAQIVDEVVKCRHFIELDQIEMTLENGTGDWWYQLLAHYGLDTGTHTSMRDKVRRFLFVLKRAIDIDQNYFQRNLELSDVFKIVCRAAKDSRLYWSSDRFKKMIGDFLDHFKAPRDRKYLEEAQWMDLERVLKCAMAASDVDLLPHIQALGERLKEARYGCPEDTFLPMKIRAVIEEAARYIEQAGKDEARDMKLFLDKLRKRAGISSNPTVSICATRTSSEPMAEAKLLVQFDCKGADDRQRLYDSLVHLEMRISVEGGFEYEVPGCRNHYFIPNTVTIPGIDNGELVLNYISSGASRERLKICCGDLAQFSLYINHTPVKTEVPQVA